MQFDDWWRKFGHGLCINAGVNPAQVYEIARRSNYVGFCHGQEDALIGVRKKNEASNRR